MYDIWRVLFLNKIFCLLAWIWFGGWFVSTEYSNICKCTFNCVLVLADIFNRQSTKRIHLSYRKFCIYWVGANLQYDTSPNVTFIVNGSGRPEVSNQLMSPVHSDVGVVTKPLTSKLTPLFKKFSTLQSTVLYISSVQSIFW